MLYKTWSTATAQDYENWGTADLDLRINNKSSAAFGQVTIPMADQWNITLGARYSYDVKGMTYITGSNAVGVPSQIIAPDNMDDCQTFPSSNQIHLHGIQLKPLVHKKLLLMALLKLYQLKNLLR